MRRIALLVALCLLWGAPRAPAQTTRFAGWERMLDPGYVFDPDERAVLGFSLQSSPSARAAFDAADSLLAAGKPVQAARRWLDAVARHGNQVLQVADEPSRGGGRWVGAGEWALYQLGSRISAARAATVATPEQRARLASAGRWRDLPALRSLSWTLEGLPEGRLATEAMARLLGEQGRERAAAAAATRALALGSGESMQRLASTAARIAESPSPAPFPDLGSLDSSWPESESAWLGRPLTLARLVARDRRQTNPFAGRPMSLEAPFAPVHPVIDDGVVFLADSISLEALDLISGRPLWHLTGPMEEVEREGVWGEHFNLGVYAAEKRPRAISPYLVARPTVLEDRVLASVQVAEPWHELDEFNGYPINHPLPWRRLLCVDRFDGHVLWRQQRPEQGASAFVNRLNVQGPPVCVGGVAYAAGSITEGAINCYAVAFDLESGELLWRTLICTGQQELTMFNRPFQEHTISPPSFHDGSLFVCTNLGVAAALDAWSGRLRWVTSYQATERRSSSSVRPVAARRVSWHAVEPFVEGHTLVVTPLDSEWMLGLDPSTGRRRWRVNAYSRYQRPPIRHQALPTGDGRVLVVSDAGVEALDADSGVLLWQSLPFGPYDELSGAAVLAGEKLLVPADPKLLVIDSHDGRLLSSPTVPDSGRALQLQCAQVGNSALLMNDGSSVFAHVDRAALAAANVPLAEDGSRADLTLAELALVGERFDEAHQRYARVLAAGDPTLAVRAGSGLAAASLARARRIDSPQTWVAVLESAPSDSDRLALAGLVLPALERLGAEASLVEWLGRLAALDPGRLIDLGPDGSRPLAQAYVLHSLPLVTPARQVALLQGLIASRAEGRWDGLPLREVAVRKVRALLLEHGRALYAPFEREAETLFDGGLSLDAVARLYPNAELVLRRRRERLLALLQAGQVREVFEQAPPDSLPELRAEAARQLGEERYAEALSGRPEPPPAPRPSLPGDAMGSVVLELSSDREVSFRPWRGQASPELLGCAVGFVEGRSELFCLDARTARVRWSGLALPGGARSTSGSVDLILHGDLLLVRGRDELAAFGLADGKPRWSRRLAGTISEVVPAAGLLISAVSSDATGDWRIEGHGMATGLPAFRVDLDDVEDVRLYKVGPYVLCHTTGRYEHTGSLRDRRLALIDPVRGELASSTPIGDQQKLVTWSDEPPTVFLSERTGSGTTLSAWSPESRTTLWSTELPGSLTQRHLLAVGSGHMLLRELVAAPGRPRPDRDRLTPIDCLTGPLATPADVPLLRVLDPPREPVDQIVLVEPDDPRVLTVLDGVSLATRYRLPVSDGPLPVSNSHVYQGRDGIVVLSVRFDPPRAEVRVVRGADPGQSYSVSLDDLHRRGVSVALVEGAVLLASGGRVHILRSATP